MYSRTQAQTYRSLLALVCAAVVTLAPGSPLGVHASSPPAQGTISRVDDLPNYFAKYDPRFKGSGIPPSTLSFVLADPANDLLIETNFGDWSSTAGPGECPSSSPSSGPRPSFTSQWVTYSAHDYHRIAVGCGLPDVDGQATIESLYNSQTAVVDSASRLVFVPCLCGDLPGTGLRTIMAVSETTLKPVGDFCAVPKESLNGCTSPDAAGDSSGGLAQAPYPYIHEMSWYAPTDDLLVVTDNFQDESPPNGRNNPTLPLGVAVTDYQVAVQPDGQVHLSLKWTVHLGTNVCQRALLDTLGLTAAAYRSENGADPALFVPCTSTTGFQGAPASTVIVRVPLRPDGTPPGDPLTDSTVKIEAITAPFAGQDFLFDAKAERGYLLPSQVSSTGMTVGVYDGGGGKTPSSFLTRIKVADSQYNAYALDPGTGRLYVDDALRGSLMVVDGRRTPVSPGKLFYPFPVSPDGVGTYQGVVMPPDAGNPYPRLFLPNITNSEIVSGIGYTHMAYFTTIADRIPLTQDPPAGTVDGNTYSGPIPPGATVTTSYSGGASGYGVHTDLVGGYAGLTDNNLPGSTIIPYPYGRTGYDLAAGAVQRSALSDGVAQARSSALFDVNGSAGQSYRACSDALSPQSCVPVPNCPVPFVPAQADPCASANGGLAPAAQPTPCPVRGADACTLKSKTTTEQDWPYLAAECSQPGPPDKQGSRSTSGMESTPPRTGDAPSSPVPHTDEARAVADCTAPMVRALGQFGCTGEVGLISGAATVPDDKALGGCSGQSAPLQIGSAAVGPQLTITSARTDTQITPPSIKDGVVSSNAMAVAQGVRIDLGNGATLQIGQVTQVVTAIAGGRPGTAHTTRRVVLQGITLTTPGEAPATYCAAPCAGDQTLLDRLNAFDPSHLYVTFPVPDEPFGTELDGISPAGSPGGYVAKVWANRAQQQGDVQFNQMNGFDGGEKTFIPAVRLILNNPGDTTVNRQVVDLAGVEADAELGVQLNGDGTIDTPTQPVTDTTQQLIQAGYSGGGAGGGPGGVSLPGQPAAAQFPPGLLGVLERALSGLSWLVRSPLGGLQMAAFLVLLGLPIMQMRRRWSWQPTARREEG